MALLPVAALVAACSTPSGPPATQTGSARTIGPLALGVNVAAWDSLAERVDPSTLTKLFRTAGIGVIRYPGGSWADEYDWSTNADSSRCSGAVLATCTASDALSFGELSAQARAADAATFVTVNYGSGTPSQAAAWVARASSGKGQAVALWEVGNETYSCHETNDHLAGSPTFVKGDAPVGTVCPSTKAMATSYAVNVVAYLRAMKKVDAAARIGVPWAFDGTESAGSGVKDASVWNATVLPSVKTDVSFVDAHWYPFDQVTGLTYQQILFSTRRIPAAATQIRKTLRRDAPGVGFIIGETNISERLTTLDFQPVSALFAAATSLTWLSQGAASVDWWDLNNFGSPAGGDYGLVSSGSPESEPAGTPFPPYYGEQLASNLTSDGSRLESFSTGSHDVLGFRSDLGHEVRILLINTAASTVHSVVNRWFGPGSTLVTLTYDPSTAGTSNPIARSTTTVGRSLALPASSIVVLSGTAGS